MEGSESEAIFDSLNLNPQLFVNEVFNISEILVNDCFDFFLQEASKSLRIEGTDRYDDLAQGVSRIKKFVDFVLNEGLTTWENYCLAHGFSLPPGFAWPQTDEASVDMLDADIIGDSELDAEIETLRNKLNLVGQECAALNKKLQTLDRQTAALNHSAALVNEVLELYQNQSASDLFNELVSASSEFHTKFEKFRKNRSEVMHPKQLQGNHTRNGDASTIVPTNASALLNSKMDELEQLWEGISSVV